MVANRILHRLHHQTRGRIARLDVQHDGGVVTIRGTAPSRHLWRLGLSAARLAVQRAGGMPFEYLVELAAQPEL